MQDLAGSLEDLGKAVALNPDLPGVHALYGQALLETGNRDKARLELEAELKRNPLDFDANLLVGVMLKDEAEYDRALGAFQAGTGVRPGDPAVRYQIATVHVSQRRTRTPRCRCSRPSSRTRRSSSKRTSRSPPCTTASSAVPRATASVPLSTR